MPQMMPLNWVSLFMMFIALVVMTMIILYFNWNMKTNTKPSMTNQFNNWKW